MKSPVCFHGQCRVHRGCDAHVARVRGVDTFSVLESLLPVLTLAAFVLAAARKLDDRRTVCCAVMRHLVCLGLTVVCSYWIVQVRVHAALA